ncbi:MAG: hypothetical protein CVU62_09610 [Deltaproteobacteria bacterium HGW-Deltaproteobacteria-2]|nr:MAG: hypothetical protein CVU62_09610 [Deltaproteobacteria bacterium HGW-Deltaproteobacteria-2]
MYCAKCNYYGLKSGMFGENGDVFVSGGELASVFRGGKGQLFCLKTRQKSGYITHLKQKTQEDKDGLQ